MSSIMAAIDLKVSSTAYNLWRIGLTHDPTEHKQYWKETGKQSTTYWSQWQADSLSDAHDIEAHFIGKGIPAR